MATNGKDDSGYWSQAGQDELVDSLLQGRRGLFFVESGGYDGEEHSNSLFFEIQRGWRGMIIEPNPHLYEQILQKNRRCMTINSAISPDSNDGVLPFVLAGPLGGLLTSFSPDHIARLESEIANGESWMSGELGSGKTVMVKTFPLHTFLKAGNPTSLVVDYWSLDTEGSEPQILAATSFSEITVGVLSVEHNNDIVKQMGIREALKSSGLVLFREAEFEYIYVNPAYFRDRGLKIPEQTKSSSRSKVEAKQVMGKKQADEIKRPVIPDDLEKKGMVIHHNVLFAVAAVAVASSCFVAASFLSYSDIHTRIYRGYSY